MSQYILDTDHLSLLQQDNQVIKQRVATIDPTNIAVTVVTAEEQLYGRLNGIRRASQSSQVDNLVLAYIRLWDTLNDLKQLNILKFSQEAFIRYAEFRRQGIRIGTQDLRIAAICLAENRILVTRNQRDFARVPGLIFEDWTI